MGPTCHPLPYLMVHGRTRPSSSVASRRKGSRRVGPAPAKPSQPGPPALGTVAAPGRGAVVSGLAALGGALSRRAWPCQGGERRVGQATLGREAATSGSCHARDGRGRRRVRGGADGSRGPGRTSGTWGGKSHIQILHGGVGGQQE